VLCWVTEDWVQDSISQGKLLTDDKYFLANAPAGSSSSKSSSAKSAPAAKKAGTKRKAADVDDDEDDDDMKDAPMAPAAADTPAAKKARSGTSNGNANGSGSASTPAPQLKTVVVKSGGAPVDEQCPKSKDSSVSVYSDASGVYDAMLNQTNIGNNNNKFYVIQLLTNGGSYWVWTRWGRVGARGQDALQTCGGVDAAKSYFDSKFHDKTKNRWINRKNFVAHSGKYVSPFPQNKNVHLYEQCVLCVHIPHLLCACLFPMS
jgi:poly [ADP-ribose] polymerase